MARSSRKQEILQAALACFTEFGVEATTIEMIRDRSGASIGSLYHHFGNRERIIAALYLEGIGEYAALLEAGLIETLDAEACVRLLTEPDWYRQCAETIRTRVERYYDKLDQDRRYRGLYEECRSLPTRSIEAPASAPPARAAE